MQVTASNCRGRSRARSSAEPRGSRRSPRLASRARAGSRRRDRPARDRCRARARRSGPSPRIGFRRRSRHRRTAGRRARPRDRRIGGAADSDRATACRALRIPPALRHGVEFGDFRGIDIGRGGGLMSAPSSRAPRAAFKRAASSGQSRRVNCPSLSSCARRPRHRSRDRARRREALATAARAPAVSRVPRGRGSTGPPTCRPRGCRPRHRARAPRRRRESPSRALARAQHRMLGGVRRKLARVTSRHSPRSAVGSVPPMA